jgi:hypothetical protein
LCSPGMYTGEKANVQNRDAPPQSCVSSVRLPLLFRGMRRDGSSRFSFLGACSQAQVPALSEFQLTETSHSSGLFP